MNQLSKFASEVIRPRLVFAAYFISAILNYLTLPLAIIFSGRRTPDTRLMIEAGIKGWELIEYKELYRSAAEFIGPDRVLKLKIDRGRSYLAQVLKALKEHRPTHYVYDPRTGSDSIWNGIVEAFIIGFALNWLRITPIIILADFSVRKWRTQAAIISATKGVVVTFLSFRTVHPIFPHNRVVGPLVMPLSEATLNEISKISEGQRNTGKPYAVFAGSLYEPRTTILNSIREKLSAKGYELIIKGRQLGGPRISDEEYWKEFAKAAIVVTTSEQIRSPGMDWSGVPSLVYRYIETLACGSLLIAPEVPGIRRYFKPGKDFIAYNAPEDGAEKIAFYLSNPEERRPIAAQGNKQARALASAHIYWYTIDVALGKYSLT